jgi:phosphoribosylformylglycinamidine cyclo-ligase
MTYRDAGVDQEAADALVPRLAKHAVRTRRVDLVGDLGGFAGLVSLEDLKERGYARPALAVSSDGVGTKVDLLRIAGEHRVAGWDCVAMSVDDVVCCGAEPVAFSDYIAIERFDADVVEEIVAGVADACVESACSLVGGETAQHPGLLMPGGYDVAGTCVGIVDLDRAWGPHRVLVGDDIVALASNGLHANGFSLVRKVLGDEDAPPGLLAPTAIYARRLLTLGEEVDVHAAAHITGGGIADNLVRVLPSGVGATIDTSTWDRAGIFDWLVSRGVSEAVMRSTFNLGVGMAVVTPRGNTAAEALNRLGVSAWVCGEVEATPGVRLD